MCVTGVSLVVSVISDVVGPFAVSLFVGTVSSPVVDVINGAVQEVEHLFLGHSVLTSVHLKSAVPSAGSSFLRVHVNIIAWFIMTFFWLVSIYRTLSFVAGDEESWTLYAELMDKVVSARHGGDAADAVHSTNMNVSAISTK